MPGTIIHNFTSRDSVFRSILTAMGLLFGIGLVGILGFMIIEGYSLLDAAYMTVITMATVGFRELAEPSTGGKIFTIGLIVVSFGIFGYVATTVTRYIVDGIFTHYFIDSKVKKSIDKLSNHVIVCGFGRNGSQSVKELFEHDNDLVIVEKSEEIINAIRDSKGFLYVHGDATQEGVLESANIANARALITTLPNDADNLFIVITARQLHPDLLIISRASDDNSDIKLKRAGASNVIMPDKIGGTRMARLVVDPDVVEFLDHVLMQPFRTGVKIEEITCNNIADCFENSSIKELDIRNQSGANIIGLKRGNGIYIVNPSADIRLSGSDQLFVLGTNEQIESLQKLIYKGI